MKSKASAHVDSLVSRHGLSVVARRVGITKQGAQGHARGESVPRPEVQLRYFEEYGVDIDGWEQPDAPKRPKRAPPQVTHSEQATPKVAAAMPATDAPDALATVVALLATTQEQLNDAKADEDVPYQARATLITSATRLCQLLAKLTGSLEVTQSMICRSSAWGRILRAFEDVFARHPEASMALAEFAKELAEMGE